MTTQIMADLSESIYDGPDGVRMKATRKPVSVTPKVTKSSYNYFDYGTKPALPVTALELKLRDIERRRRNSMHRLQVICCTLWMIMDL